MKRILLIVVVLLIVAQFIRPKHNDGVAAAATDITHAVHVPDTVMSLLRTSCYDCHSNHTTYPWYSKISPVNWWLANHINDGKRALNFTTFATYSYKRMGKKLKSAAHDVHEGDMPLNSYLWIHTYAKLNDAQKKLIVDWADSAQAEVMRDSLQHVPAR